MKLKPVSLLMLCLLIVETAPAGDTGWGAATVSTRIEELSIDDNGMGRLQRVRKSTIVRNDGVWIEIVPNGPKGCIWEIHFASRTPRSKMFQATKRIVITVPNRAQAPAAQACWTNVFYTVARFYEPGVASGQVVRLAGDRVTRSNHVGLGMIWNDTDFPVRWKVPVRYDGLTGVEYDIYNLDPGQEVTVRPEYEMWDQPGIRVFIASRHIGRDE